MSAHTGLTFLVLVAMGSVQQKTGVQRCSERVAWGRVVASEPYLVALQNKGLLTALLPHAMHTTVSLSLHQGICNSFVSHYVRDCGACMSNTIKLQSCCSGRCGDATLLGLRLCLSKASRITGAATVSVGCGCQSVVVAM